MKLIRALRWLSMSVVLSSLSPAVHADTPVNLAVPLGLPPMVIPASNPLTQEKIDLGRRLFMDRRLSHNNVMSCGMCHVPEQGFTSHELGTAIGLEGRSLRRNSPTIFNVGYQRSFFHDGREPHLEDHAWSPLLNKNEMDMPSIGYVVEKVRQLPEYKGLFEAAFKGPVNAERLGHALASYQRTLVSGNSRFDRWYYGGEKNALTPKEQLGFQVFMGKGRCGTCHLVSEKSALFTDHKFHNTGLGWDRTMFPERKSYRVQLAPNVFVDVLSKLLKPFEPTMPDVGRYEVTTNPRDSWAYKTPILRDLELTPPYMHDGSLRTLEEVIDFYDKGGIDNPEKSPLITRLNLTPEEKSALVGFLKSLTGDNIPALVRDARQVPENLPILDQDPIDIYMNQILASQP